MSEQQTLEERALESVAERFRLNALKLPSLPEVTIRVRTIAADPTATDKDLAAEILRDAALTARLIRIANSPLLRGRVEVRTLLQAITRLGFYYVRDLATALAMESIFEPKSDMTRQILRKISRRSKTVAAISHILARHRTRLPPEQALLAGLLHFIGALPLLVAIDEQKLDGAGVDNIFEMIESRHSEVGVRILRHLRFADDIAVVPECYRDGHRNVSDKPDYTDVVAVASLLAEPMDEVGKELPNWEDFMPAQKLGLENPGDFFLSDEMQADLDQTLAILS
jgi:HD-like signal output (HDOD) protein